MCHVSLSSRIEIRIRNQQSVFATRFFVIRKVRSDSPFSLTVFFHEGFVDLVRGADPGSTITAGLEVLGKIFGEDVNKEITKVDF